MNRTGNDKVTQKEDLAILMHRVDATAFIAVFLKEMQIVNVINKSK
jgi:hypothetical protein